MNTYLTKLYLIVPKKQLQIKRNLFLKINSFKFSSYAPRKQEYKNINDKTYIEQSSIFQDITTQQLQQIFDDRNIKGLDFNNFVDKNNQQNLDLKARLIKEGGIQLVQAFEKCEQSDSDFMINYDENNIFERDVSQLVVEEYIKQYNQKNGLKDWKKFNIFVGNSGSGIKPLRYLKNINQDFLQNITTNDTVKNFKTYLQQMVYFNNLDDKKIQIIRDDIEDVLFDTVNQHNPETFYNIIDIEGNDNILQYFPQLLRSLHSGGLMCLNFNQLPSFSNIQSVEKSFYKYGLIKSELGDEIESVIRGVYTTLNDISKQQDKILKPILTFKSQNYTKLYFTVHKSKSEAKKHIQNLNYIYNCVQCPNFEFQPLVQQFPHDKQNKGAQIKINQHTCSECGSPQILNGPIYTGELNDAEYCQNILKNVKILDPQTYISKLVMRGFFEQLTYQQQITNTNPIGTSISSLKNAFLIKQNELSTSQIRSCLLQLGYKSVLSYLQPQIIKTDANQEIIFQILRKWKLEQKNNNQNSQQTDKPEQEKIYNRLMKKQINSELVDKIQFQICEESQKLFEKEKYIKSTLQQYNLINHSAPKKTILEQNFENKTNN